MKGIRGYKVFNPDWTCRGFRYEVGKVYEEDVQPKTCSAGFHYCENAADCFDYYGFNSDNKVAEVLALGDVDSDGKKSCTNKIQILREIPWEELLKIVNTGKGCSGLRNSGDRNSGNRNSGDWNSGDRNSGCFCTETPTISFFNKPSEWTYEKWVYSNARSILSDIPSEVLEWVYSENMTEQEKKDHPEHTTTGGFLRMLTPSEGAQAYWDSLSEEEKDCIRELPNFDPVIFEKCTGIKTE